MKHSPRGARRPLPSTFRIGRAGPAASRHARPSVNQGAIDSEVIARQLRLDARQTHLRGKKFSRHICRHQPVAVVAEHRRMPDGGVDRQSGKSAEQQVVVDLPCKLAFRAPRAERLQHGRPQQHLGSRAAPLPNTFPQTGCPKPPEPDPSKPGSPATDDQQEPAASAGYS